MNQDDKKYLRKFNISVKNPGELFTEFDVLERLIEHGDQEILDQLSEEDWGSAMEGLSEMIGDQVQQWIEDVSVRGYLTSREICAEPKTIVNLTDPYFGSSSWWLLTKIEPEIKNKIIGQTILRCSRKVQLVADIDKRGLYIYATIVDLDGREVGGRTHIPQQLLRGYEFTLQGERFVII